MPQQNPHRKKRHRPHHSIISDTAGTTHGVFNGMWDAETKHLFLIVSFSSDTLSCAILLPFLYLRTVEEAAL